MDRQKYTDRELEDKLTCLMVELNRIPSYRDLNRADRYPFHITYVKRYGTWNKALQAAGIGNNTMTEGVVQSVSADGHICRSLEERILDDALYKRNIKHERHVPYPGCSDLTCDFVIDDIWIEIDNSYLSEHHGRIFEWRRRIATNIGLHLVVIDRDDIISDKWYDRIFSR